METGLFFGLGADGTVGANKNTIKIIGENTELLHRVILFMIPRNLAPEQFHTFSVWPGTYPCPLPDIESRFYCLPPVQFHRKSGDA